MKSRVITFLTFFFCGFTQHSYAQCDYSVFSHLSMITDDFDTVYTKKNGHSAIMIYFPNGDLKSQKISCKSKPGSKGSYKGKSKYTEWNESGRKVQKLTEKWNNVDSHYKYIKWMYRDNGKICVRRIREIQKN